MKISITGLLAFTCLFQAHGIDGAQSRSGEVQSVTIGSTLINISRPVFEAQNPPSALITFDNDVRANGNILPGGTYEIGIQLIADDDAHVIFRERIREDREAQGKIRERLRLAVRPVDAPEVDQPTIEIEAVKPPEPREGRRRSRRRRPRPPAAKLNIHWEARAVTIDLVMTGLLWRSTPPPEIPAPVREPWAIVLSSLNGLVEQSLEKHAEHFADNFESDWDDGGSEEAHAQFVGRMLFDGSFEGSVLKLDKLLWTENDDGSIHFRDMVILGGFGAASLEYRVAETKQGWKIIHLDGPKE